MEAAGAVFAERGFEAAPMSEIAARAEVSLATVYDLFDGKEDLYRSALTEASASILASVTRAVEALTDPGERLRALPAALCACFEENRDLLRIYVRDAHGMPWRARNAMGAEGEPILREFDAWLMKLAEDAAAAGLLKVTTARVFAFVIEGAITTTALRVMELTPEENLETMVPELRAVVTRLLESDT
ncbi:MAG: hypothetical protein CL910_04225 [Deltaproteobacteria bacterium]|jgi:AcrR family transcriptional regulator|nr:hypothetical protein [Deltaproteobacteria bacterium]